MNDIANIIELILVISGTAYWIEILVGIKKIIEKQGDKE